MKATTIKAAVILAISLVWTSSVDAVTHKPLHFDRRSSSQYDHAAPLLNRCRPRPRGGLMGNLQFYGMPTPPTGTDFSESHGRPFK